MSSLNDEATLNSDSHWTPDRISRVLDRVLLAVEKPARYVGGEHNSVVKDWAAASVRAALVFPDIYELGMSNLGLATLYDILNRRPDLIAERAYCPWTDMEAIMRRERMPLFSLETRHPLADFDLIGVSLPYEQLYSNVLNLLDLGGIPLFASERDATHPIASSPADTPPTTPTRWPTSSTRLRLARAKRSSSTLRR
jgi:hypothetical protein